VNAIDAAYQILTEAGEPLHSSEIARRILGRGLWTTKRVRSATFALGDDLEDAGAVFLDQVLFRSRSELSV
jgi:hypothetical protein